MIPSTTQPAHRKESSRGGQIYTNVASQPKQTSFGLFNGLPSELLAIISPPGPPDAGNDKPVEATNIKAMGSYNWIDHPTPTIAIPGHPAKWKDLQTPIHLRKELGSPFYYEETARECGYPLEPDLRAIQVTQESLGETNFELSKERIDIVTNRNNLRKLFRFAGSGVKIGGRSNFPRFDSFRIDAQLAPNGRTMVLTRYEPPVKETRNESSYFHVDEAFERTCTQELPPINATDVDGSKVGLRLAGYNRIVRYDLLGLRFLVHSRVDAMVEEGTKRKFQNESEVDDLANTMQETHLSPTRTPEHSHPSIPIVQIDGSKLRHVELGECVPQEKLTDVKTAFPGKMKWDVAYPQFFLSQTPNLKVGTRVIAKAVNEEFITHVRTYTRDSLQTQHTRQSPQIRQFVDVLAQMRAIMQTHGVNSPLAFVCDQAGPMNVYRIRSPGKYLSDEGLDQF